MEPLIRKHGVWYVCIHATGQRLTPHMHHFLFHHCQCLICYKYFQIFEDAPPKVRTSSPAAISEHQGQRWATETTVHDWVEDGSVVVGEWPETMQEVWNKALAMMRNQLEDERNKVQGELADLTQNFNAYKQRAQTGTQITTFVGQMYMCACHTLLNHCPYMLLIMSYNLQSLVDSIALQH